MKSDKKIRMAKTRSGGGNAKKDSSDTNDKSYRSQATY